MAAIILILGLILGITLAVASYKSDKAMGRTPMQIRKSNKEINEYNNQTVINKALAVSNIMQTVIDQVEILPAPVASGTLMHSFEEFTKSLNELQIITSQVPSTLNILITVDGQKVPVKNIITGAVMFKGEIKRRIQGL
ncbi:MAG: hypothetical protein LUH22_06955 [Bacteroides sp.]|nr:hypothetical protein [Bacteroides sp.]